MIEEKQLQEELNDVDLSSTELITTLPPKVQRFIHLFVTGQYTINKLAQLLEVHPNTVYNWLRNKDVKQCIDDLQSVTHEIVAIQLKNMTNKATAKLNSLIDSPIDGVALNAVKDVLDRSGHKPKQEIKIDKTVRTFEEKLQDIIGKTITVEDYTIVDENE